MKKNILNAIPFGVIIVVCIIMRLTQWPHNNFIPVGALALLSGIYIRSRWGILLTLVLMVATDFIIGLHSLILFTWGSYLLIGAIGWWVRSRMNVWKVCAGTLFGSVTFFIVTNFAVWAFTPMYERSVAGLVQCFYMAVPFFRNTLSGDIFFIVAFFGLREAVRLIITLKQKKLVIVPTR
jgi:hypothetical protein